ncbi:MAG TPA: hypothetical protein P5336_10400, partial [Treponema sp.]|nr:hypothetical protein [Treponema sp.]
MKWCFQARLFSLLIFAILLLMGCFGLGQVYAGGKQEDPLAAADTLIAERKYNEAILLLTQFIKTNPDRFDDAQRRLQRIVKLREEYNAIAGELLNVLVTDPTNDERKLAMIRQLESLEAAPNRAAREFILKTKETALFTYNRAQFEKIMADGRALIDKGDYIGASRRYSEGFSLYREEFYQAGYGDIIVNNVNQGLKNIQDNLTIYATLQPELQKRIDAFINLTKTVSFTTELGPIIATYDELENLLLQYAVLRNSITSVGRGFENQFALLQSGDANLGDSSFLPFAFRFILGRKTEIQPEGIVGAMDTFWVKGVNGLETAMVQSLNGLYQDFINQYKENPLVMQDLRVEKLRQYADFSLRILSIWSPIAAKELVNQVTNYGKSIAVNKTPVYLSVQAGLENTSTLAQYYRVLKDVLVLTEQQQSLFAAWQSGNSTQENAVAGLLGVREKLIALRNTLKNNENEAARRIEVYRGYQEKNIDLSASIAQLQQGADNLVFLEQHINEQELVLASRRYSIENAGLKTVLNARNEVFNRAQSLLQGVQVTPQGGAAYLAKYPKESLPLLNELNGLLTTDIQKTNTLLAIYNAEPVPVKDATTIKTLQQETTELLQQFSSFQTQVRANISTAQQQSALADSLRLEGDRRYQEAQTALKNLNFDLARQRLQQSGERYDASLAVQDSQDLRALRDQRLLSLAAEISKTENETVVRDVRRLITDAKKAYFAGDFTRAEDILLQAQNRWKT